MLVQVGGSFGIRLIELVFRFPVLYAAPRFRVCKHCLETLEEAVHCNAKTGSCVGMFVHTPCRIHPALLPLLVHLFSAAAKVPH